MISNLIFESKVVAFADITFLPVEGSVEQTDFCCLPHHPDSTGILSRESALLLLQLHPLVLWTRKHYCVLGRRVLHLVSPYLYKRDQIRVGYLASAKKKEIEKLMAAEPLLNQIAFATQSGSQGIFTTSFHTAKDLLTKVAPILNMSIESIAKLFPDCSASTLYKLSAKLNLISVELQPV